MIFSVLTACLGLFILSLYLVVLRAQSKLPSSCYQTSKFLRVELRQKLCSTY